MEFLSEYDFTIEHRKGLKHGNSDGMSRYPNSEDCKCDDSGEEIALKCGPCVKCLKRAEQMESTLMYQKHADHVGGKKANIRTRTVHVQEPRSPKHETGTMTSLLLVMLYWTLTVVRMQTIGIIDSILMVFGIVYGIVYNTTQYLYYINTTVKQELRTLGEIAGIYHGICKVRKKIVRLLDTVAVYYGVVFGTLGFIARCYGQRYMVDNAVFGTLGRIHGRYAGICTVKYAVAAPLVFIAWSYGCIQNVQEMVFGTLVFIAWSYGCIQKVKEIVFETLDNMAQLYGKYKIQEKTETTFYRGCRHR